MFRSEPTVVAMRARRQCDYYADQLRHTRNVPQKYRAEPHSEKRLYLLATDARKDPTGTFQTGPLSEPCAKVNPSSAQPVMPPIISFTLRPNLPRRNAALSAPLQCGPAQ
jgi:hypothetical protein